MSTRYHPHGLKLSKGQLKKLKKKHTKLIQQLH